MSKGKITALISASLGLLLIAAVGGFLIGIAQNQQIHGLPAYARISQPDGGNSGASPKGVGATSIAQPCRDAVGVTESELCAQWVAADSAQQNLLWTQRQFWIGLITTIGLAATIFLTLRAVIASERSLSHAKETARIELRAYMGFDSPTLERVPLRDTQDEIWFEATITFRNYGSTPAGGVVCRFDATLKDGPIKFDEIEYDWSNVGFIAQGDFFTGAISFGISKEKEALFSNSELSIYAAAEIRYRDVFGKAYSDRVGLEAGRDLVWSALTEFRAQHPDSNVSEQPRLI